jgi:hypothetical protein
MILSDACSKIYIGNCPNFTQIKSNIPTIPESAQNNFGKRSDGCIYDNKPGNIY